MDEKNINENSTVSGEPVEKVETVTITKEELNKMLNEGFKQMLSDYMMTVKTETKEEPKEEPKKEETLEDFLF